MMSSSGLGTLVRADFTRQDARIRTPKQSVIFLISVIVDNIKTKSSRPASPCFPSTPNRVDLITFYSPAPVKLRQHKLFMLNVMHLSFIRGSID